MTREPKRYPLAWMKKDRDLWERMLAEMPVHKAAPDMLAALQMWATELRGKAMNAAELAAYKATRAAIAKATE